MDTALAEDRDLASTHCRMGLYGFEQGDSDTLLALAFQKHALWSSPLPEESSMRQ
jgi:hypothetical protein